MSAKNRRETRSRVLVGIQIGITSSCAVVRDGRVVFASSEERYSQVKNDTAFPEAAIKDAISKAQVDPADVEAVVLVSRRMSPEQFLISREARFSIKDYLREQSDYYHPRLFDQKKVEYLDVFRDRIDERYADLYRAVAAEPARKTEIWNSWRIDRVARLVGVSTHKVHIVNHEHAHAAYAYYGSPFRGPDTLVVTFDGFGDEANCTVSGLQGEALGWIRKYTDFNVGRVYRYITLLLGMKPNEHEYKVMGLAPYATEYTCRGAARVFDTAYQFGDDGEIRCDPALKDNYYYFKERLEGERFDGIAGALQGFTERMTCGLVRHWLRKTGKKRIVLSGGVSLNIKANMEIGKLPEVADLFVPGSGGDESLCIGAVYAHLDSTGRGAEVEPLSTLCLGPGVDAADIDKALERIAASGKGTVIRNVDSSRVAHELAAGKVLGRVDGRMEFGARALGNRSILANPQDASIIRKINAQIKSRDFWMPFTPSMLPDAARDYLDNPKGFRYPYMSVACHATKLGREHLGGALHPADHTARPQIVEPEVNPGYFDLLTRFRELTGIGALLNTSLNLHGDPIAMTPAHAARVFENSSLDGLVLGGNLVRRT